MNLKKINFITNNFFSAANVSHIDLIDSGLINKTYIVEYTNNGKNSKFILQSLSNIFDSYDIVNLNHNLITAHIQNKINEKHPIFDNQRWDVPSLIRCKSNCLYVFPFDSEIWRAMLYIDDTVSFDTLGDNFMAYQTGIGLAKFHKSCSDFECVNLKKSIKNFHNVKFFMDEFKAVTKDFSFIKSDEKVNKRVQNLVFILTKHIFQVELILGHLKEKVIDTSVIHGDPKLSNFLFDIQKKYVVSLIDLDTVSSGYLLTDLSDCIRSICNLAGEDPDEIENVSFDLHSFNYFLKGYFSIQNQKSSYCFELLPEFIYLIIVELTIRFLNDFLQSNRYFKIKYQTHNLYRAEVQYRLLSSYVNQLPALSQSLYEIGICSSSTFVSDVQKIV